MCCHHALRSCKLPPHDLAFSTDQDGAGQSRHLIAGLRGAAPAGGEALGLFVRNVHFGKAAGSGCVHCRGNPINVAMHGWPLRIAQYHDRNSAAFEVLLVLDVFIGG